MCCVVFVLCRAATCCVVFVWSCVVLCWAELCCGVGGSFGAHLHPHRRPLRVIARCVEFAATAHVLRDLFLAHDGLSLLGMVGPKWGHRGLGSRAPRPGSHARTSLVQNTCPSCQVKPPSAVPVRGAGAPHTPTAASRHLSSLWLTLILHTDCILARSTNRCTERTHTCNAHARAPWLGERAMHLSIHTERPSLL